MTFNLQSFPSYHAAFGELVESSSSEKQAVDKIADELHHADPFMIRAIILCFQFYHNLTKHHLRQWRPEGYKISNGELNIVRKACLQTMQRRGMSRSNFGNHSDEPFKSYATPESQLPSTTSALLYAAIDDGILFELSELSSLPNLVTKAEKHFGQEALYRPTHELMSAIPSGDIEDYLFFSGRVTHHLNCFMQGVYQVRLRHIRAMVLDSVMSLDGTTNRFMSNGDLTIRLMHFIGYIDAAVDSLNDRTSFTKSLVERNPSAKDVRSIVRGNCATARALVTQIRGELKHLVLIAPEQLQLFKRFPAFFPIIARARSTEPVN